MFCALQRVSSSTPSSISSSSRHLLRLSSSNPHPKSDKDAETPKVEVLKGKYKPPGDEILESSPKLLSTVVPAVKKSLFGGRSSAPMNWNYPNKKLEDQYVEELPLGEVIKDIPSITKKQIKLLKKEVAEYLENPMEKYDLGHSIQGLKHGEAKVEYDFKAEDSLEIWNTGCDADWNQGFSKVELIRTPRKTALFKGFICTEVPKDGKTERAGWASIKTEDHLAFKRKKKMWDWRHYSHFMIKCRGDGRSYKLMMFVPGAVDLTWGDTYAYPLHTHGGPYWQYEKVPFSRFLHTVGGRIQDNQRRLKPIEISSIGITLMDRIDGEFQLEIDFIGCYNDTSHEEKFAYESYSIPMFNPQTM